MYGETTLGASAAQAYAGAPAAPVLDGVAQVAERSEMIADRLQRFLDRFHGMGQDKAPSVAPVPCGYIGQLQRLAITVDRLERITSDIDGIG
jgi:hypothetical protein